MRSVSKLVNQKKNPVKKLLWAVYILILFWMFTLMISPWYISPEAYYIRYNLNKTIEWMNEKGYAQAKPVAGMRTLLYPYSRMAGMVNNLSEALTASYFRDLSQMDSIEAADNPWYALKDYQWFSDDPNLTEIYRVIQFDVAALNPSNPQNVMDIWEGDRLKYHEIAAVALKKLRHLYQLCISVYIVLLMPIYLVLLKKARHSFLFRSRTSILFTKVNASLEEYPGKGE